MGKRQRRREREQLLQDPVPDSPQRQDVTVIPGTAAASGGPGPDEDSED